FVLHRNSNIIFSVKRPRYESDCGTRHKFPNENHAAPPCVRRFPPNVETQIYFLEIAVQRNWQAQKACVEKQKPNNTEECFTVVKFGPGFGWNERCDQARIGQII